MPTARTHQPNTDPAPASVLRDATLDAPIVEVTLMEDRAQIRRRGKVRLTAGRSRLAIENVATVLSDKTLTVSARARGDKHAHVEDVRVRRSIDASQEGQDDDERNLRTDLATALDELGEATHERASAEHWVNGLQDLQQQMLQDIADDTAWGRDAGNRWTREQKQLVEQLAKASDRQTLAIHQLTRVQQRVDDLRARLEALGQQDSGTRHAQIEVDLHIDEGGTYEITVDYVTPNACWRPYHAAQLATDNRTSTVVLQTDGCVWQNTGEDWTDVRLAFSTLRPSLGTHPPTLTTDRIEAQRREELVVETQAQKLYTTGLAKETVSSKGLPGVDDKGRVVRLEANDTVDIPSDGRPVRVPLFQLSTPAQIELVCKPELAPAVLLVSQQENTSNHPLLAGPIDLIRNGGYVGRATLDYVTTGGVFELGWGAPDTFRVHREHRKVQKETKAMGRWDATEHQIRLTLSNLGMESAIVRLTERVPVSAVEQVQVAVDVKHTTESLRPDANGMIAWDLTLAPHGHEQIELRYSVRKLKSST